MVTDSKKKAANEVGTEMKQQQHRNNIILSNNMKNNIDACSISSASSSSSLDRINVLLKRRSSSSLCKKINDDNNNSHGQDNEFNKKAMKSSSLLSSSSLSLPTMFIVIMDYMLSMVWFLLCCLLVYKHQDLVLVFYSFITCFIISGLISYVKKELFNIPINSNTNIITKLTVGLIYCMISFYKIIPGLIVISTTMTTSLSYDSFSIMTGYLIYDQWFTGIYCDRKQQQQCTTVEDAITITLIVVYLVHHIQQQQQQQGYDNLFIDKIACTWIVYKMIRLIYQLKHISSTSIQQKQHEMYQEKKKKMSATATTAASTSSSVVLQKPVPSVTSTTTEKHNNNIYIWNIYGNQYDLTNYIYKHPGGIEAILLGANRNDCTALFQSYHPFNIKHAQSILHRYQINKKGNNRVIKELINSFQENGPTLTNQDSCTSTSINQPNLIYDTKTDQDTVSLNNNSNHYQYHHNDILYQIICDRVEMKLKEYHIDPIKDRTATKSRILYYMIISILLLGSFILHCTGSIIGSFLLGIFGWLIGSLGHDSGHFATSRIPLINDIGVWGMSLLCNPMMWQHQHTYGHHSYTNEYHHDPDLHHFTVLLRVHKLFQYNTIYQYQTKLWYVILSYSMVVFGTCFWIPWGMIKEQSLYGMIDWTDHNRLIRRLGMYIHLFGYVSIIMILPFFVCSSYIIAIASVIVHITTSGLIFALFSQINHLNERSLEHDDDKKHNNNKENNNETNNENSNKNYDINNHNKKQQLLLLDGMSPEQRRHYLDTVVDSWAMKQIESSNNFCPNSTLWYILSNGLNLQIEHHLFPGLNHCHLPIIQSTVETVCDEYGICYKSYNSWNDLMKATLDWLVILSSSTNDDDNNNDNRK